MKFVYSVITLIGMVCAGTVSAQTISFPAQEIKDRHDKALRLLNDSSWIVLKAPSPVGEAKSRYQTNSDLLWLTGTDKPNVAFMLFPKGKWESQPVVSSILFSDGELHGNEPFDTILPASQFQKMYSRLEKNFRVLYTRLPEPEFIHDWLNNKGQFLHLAMIRAKRKKNENLSIEPVGRITTPLREIKSPFETELIREAINLTGTGIIKAMQRCTTGRYEYELQAAFENAVKSGGAITTSFPSIVGSGPNGLILHHEENGRQMKDGDLVVMDVGAWYNGYSADVTRTFPVNGRFSEIQRKLYNLVLTAHKKAIETVKPGTSMAQLQRVVQSTLDSAGFDSRYLPHGISHPVGVDVHDVMHESTLLAGMIITIEPGIYIPVDDTTLPAEYRGIGIRIEDDVLVTTDGAVVLSDQIPVTTDEIEKVMNMNSKRREEKQKEALH